MLSSAFISRHVQARSHRRGHVVHKSIVSRFLGAQELHRITGLWSVKGMARQDKSPAAARCRRETF